MGKAPLPPTPPPCAGEGRSRPDHYQAAGPPPTRVDHSPQPSTRRSSRLPPSGSASGRLFERPPALLLIWGRIGRLFGLPQGVLSGARQQSGPLGLSECPDDALLLINPR